MRTVVGSILLSLLCWGCQKNEHPAITSPTPFLNVESMWVDSMLTSMTTDEKIGQLVLYRTELSESCQEDSVLNWVEKGQIGGLLIENTSLFTFLDLSDSLRSIAKVPLFIGTGEAGMLNNQFSDITGLPHPNTLSTIASDSLKAALMQLYVKQAYQLGINFSLAPPLDPKDNLRPFSSRFVEFSGQHGLLGFADGIELNALLSDRDSSCQLDALLDPFEQHVNRGISGFWIKTENTPGDSLYNYPKFFLKQHFRSDLNFGGLILSEVENPQGIWDMIHAGVDVFVVEQNPEEAFITLQQAVAEKVLSPTSLNDRVRRVLLAKRWMHKKEQPTLQAQEDKVQTLQASFGPLKPAEEKYYELDNGALWSHFKDKRWDILQWKLYEQSLVLASNRDSLIPFQDILSHKFHLVQYGSRSLRVFKKYFGKYAGHTSQFYKTKVGEAFPALRSPRRKGLTTIVTIDNLLLDPARDAEFMKSLEKLKKNGRLVIINFGELTNLAPFDTTVTFIQAFERNDITEALTAQMLFGGIGAQGMLPIKVNAHFQEGDGAQTEAIRLKYGMPEETGIAPEKLVGINAIINSAIDKGAMPGCQVMVAKDGVVIYSNAFGHHAFNEKREVKTTDLYDIASITKVAATTLGAMELYENKQFALTDRTGDHLDWEERSSIKWIQLRKLLTHQSGLQPNMPVGKYLLYRNAANAACDSFFCKVSSDTFAIRIADSFYFDRKHLDNIWERVHRLPVGSQRRYRYSDLNFMLLKEVIEQKVDTRLDNWLEDQFYQPLGLRTSAFNPIDRFGKDRIVPTENDRKWRHQLIHGYVHDETAALFGGVGGHAGMFSNAEDLGVIFQMLLNGGHYGGKTYLEKETIDLFTSRQPGSGRGLGFDRIFRSSRSAYTKKASANTYGHTGFTGTAVWTDPDNQLIYVFLSNRINPSIYNKKIFHMRVRERVHQVVYDALDSYEFIMPDLPTLPGHQVKGIID